MQKTRSIDDNCIYKDNHGHLLFACCDMQYTRYDYTNTMTTLINIWDKYPLLNLIDPIKLEKFMLDNDNVTNELMIKLYNIIRTERVRTFFIDA